MAIFALHTSYNIAGGGGGANSVTLSPMVLCVDRDFNPCWSPVGGQGVSKRRGSIIV